VIATRSGASRSTPTRATASRKQHVNATPRPLESVAFHEQGTLSRLLTTCRHLGALLVGALVATANERRGVGGRLSRLLSPVLRRTLRRDLRDLPFPVQLRRRLELLGPTYIKLGQILSLREDLLPTAITDELKNLLDRLPGVEFDAIATIVEHDLQRPLVSMFEHVDHTPLGSASIAQIHRARTIDGDDVVLKVVKPGIRETLERDARILRVVGRLLNLAFARYQPRRVIDEFCEYTLREVDLRREADNAETFTANFADRPEVVFPRVYRQYSGRDVLCMEFLDGVRPDSPDARALSQEDREHLVDVGAEAIIRMLYQDGVFHADLHPGNLLVLEGPRAGFIDLGMVGRFDGELRRTLLYYYYCLVSGDAEGASRYLSAVALPGVHGDPVGFRRDVAEISSRWRHAATFEGFSLARLILESVQRGAHYRMYFPVELVLMVKALITFEGVGHVLLPGFDIAEVSQRHIRRIFLHQFSPLRVLHEGVRNAPDLIDAAVKIPLLVTEGLRVLDRSVNRPAENPFAGLRGTLVAGFSLVAASILAAFGAPWPVWSALFLFALLLAFRRGG
jgi:ubiquinone biosynthesis protein